MLNNIKQAIFAIHFFAITGLILWVLYPLTWPISMPAPFWIKQIAENAGYTLIYFGNAYVLSPKLLSRGKVAIYIISLLVTIYLMVTYNAWMQDTLHIDDVLAKVFSPGKPIYQTNHHLRDKWTTFICLVVLGLSNIATTSRKLQSQQLAIQIAEKEKIGAELAFLKAQINPHFFFNTLHTIYAMTDTDPASAKESLYTLSHMMRYVIYETKHDLTSLKKEIKFIEDYIRLMRVRIGSEIEISFKVQPGIHDFSLAPMLFLPFVENAFKHGISAKHLSYIYIDVTATEDILKFKVLNSVFSSAGRQLDDEDGIGVSNTKRRLDLLYPNKYHLLINHDEGSNEYMTLLTLQTHDN